MQEIVFCWEGKEESFEIYFKDLPPFNGLLLHMEINTLTVTGRNKNNNSNVFHLLQSPPPTRQCSLLCKYIYGTCTKEAVEATGEEEAVTKYTLLYPIMVHGVGQGYSHNSVHGIAAVGSEVMFSGSGGVVAAAERKKKPRNCNTFQS